MGHIFQLLTIWKKQILKYSLLFLFFFLGFTSELLFILVTSDWAFMDCGPNGILLHTWFWSIKSFIVARVVKKAVAINLL